MTVTSTTSSCLCIFAHPDDEVFRCSGTLALLSRSGVRVWVLSFTSGQADSCGAPPICKPEKLGDIRKEELRCSYKILGLEAPIILDYQDGALCDVRSDELEDIIEGYIHQMF